MKRISGTFVLLAGLSGCMSFTPGPGEGEKKTSDDRPGMPGAPAPGMAMANAPVSLPTNPTWMAHPEHQAVPVRPSDEVAARLQTSYAPVTPPGPAAPPPVPAPQALAMAPTTPPA